MSKAMACMSRAVASLMMGLGMIGCLALAGIAAASESAVFTAWPEPDAFCALGTTSERIWCIGEGDYAEWMWAGESIDGAVVERAAINVTAWVSDRVFGRTGIDTDVAVSIYRLDGTLAEAGILHLENPFEPLGEGAPDPAGVGYVAQGAYVLRDPTWVSRGFRLRTTVLACGDGGSEFAEGRGAFAATHDSAVLAYRISSEESDVSVAAVSLAEVLADPRSSAGQGVRFDGMFYGAMTELVDGVPPECIYSGCDVWVFGVDGWYIYVVGQVPAGLDSSYTEDLGAGVGIEGIVRVQLSRAAQPYAFLELTSAIPGEDAVDLRIVDAETADGGAVVLSPGETLAIDLPSNPTTGYRWELVCLEPTGVAGVVGAETGMYFQDHTAPGAIGSGGVQRFVIVGEATGEALLQLAYRRAWEVTAAETFSLTIHVAATADGAQVGVP